jgi:ABC-type transport system involved in multi-copper enzyme maturation permease subunit
MKSFRDLHVRGKISVIALYTMMNIRVVFGVKAILFLLATAIYYTAFYTIAVKTEAQLTLDQALAWLVWMPVTVFAVFFSMEMISRERDAGLLETLFTVSVSIYRLWIIKFLTLMLCVSVLALILIAVSYWYVVDIPIMLTFVYVLPPVIFFAGLTVLLSAMLKSGNAAGICVIALLAFVMITYEGLGSTIVFPYLNPFERPYYTEPYIWVRTVAYNKIAYALLGVVWFWRALRWLDRRERLLK